MTTSLDSAVRGEVETLHRHFVGWFTGALDETQFEACVVRRLDPEIVFISPEGVVMGFEALVASLRRGHGTNPDFRIAIRDVTVRALSQSHVIATYQEWQRDARASAAPNNARIATAVFAAGPPLRWLQVHETWLPAAVAAAGPFDF